MFIMINFACYVVFKVAIMDQKHDADPWFTVPWVKWLWDRRQIVDGVAACFCFFGFLVFVYLCVHPEMNSRIVAAVSAMFPTLGMAWFSMRMALNDRSRAKRGDQ